MYDTLTGLQLIVDRHMAGMKKAVRQGGKLYVSPAMYDLISHAEGDELERLLSAIPCTEIPEFDLGKYAYEAMFASPP